MCILNREGAAPNVHTTLAQFTGCLVGASSNEGFPVNTIIKTTNVCDASSVGDGLAGWPVTVGVVEVGVIDTGAGWAW